MPANDLKESMLVPALNKSSAAASMLFDVIFNARKLYSSSNPNSIKAETYFCCIASADCTEDSIYI
jgi:hypothetical protein